MTRLLLLIVAIGAGIGLMVPSHEEAAPPQTAALSEAPAADDTEEEPVETRLGREEDGHFYVHAEVNGELVRFLVDTGASGVALPVESAERLGIDFSEADFEVVGTGASGPVRGQRVLLDSVEVDGKRVSEVEGAVIEGLEVPLLGQSYLSRIGSVEMSGETMTLN